LILNGKWVSQRFSWAQGRLPGRHLKKDYAVIWEILSHFSEGQKIETAGDSEGLHREQAEMHAVPRTMPHFNVAGFGSGISLPLRL
jgi:hypothetical protein